MRTKLLLLAGLMGLLCLGPAHPVRGQALHLDNLLPGGQRLLPEGHELLEAHPIMRGEPSKGHLLLVSRHRYEKQTMTAVTKGRETDMVVGLEGRQDHYFFLYSLNPAEKEPLWKHVEPELRGFALAHSDGWPTLFLTTPRGVEVFSLDQRPDLQETLPAGFLKGTEGWTDLPRVVRDKIKDDRLLVLPGDSSLEYFAVSGRGAAKAEGPAPAWTLPAELPFEMGHNTAIAAHHSMLMPRNTIVSHRGIESVLFISGDRVAAVSLEGEILFSWYLPELLPEKAGLTQVLDMDGDGLLDLVFEVKPDPSELKNGQQKSFTGGWLCPENSEAKGTWTFPGFPQFVELDGRPGLEALVFEFEVGFFRMLRAVATRTLKADMVITRWTPGKEKYRRLDKQEIKVKVKLSRIKVPFSLTAMEDWNGDGLKDLFWVDLKDKAHFRAGQADGTLGKTQKVRLSLPKDVDLGGLQIRDLDGDGHWDLLVPFSQGESERKGLAWYLSKPAGEVTP